MYGVDERVQAFLNRPLEGAWPYLWIDATYLKVRRGRRIMSVAAIVAVAVDTYGRRGGAIRSRKLLERLPALSGGSSIPPTRWND